MVSNPGFTEDLQSGENDASGLHSYKEITIKP